MSEKNIDIILEENIFSVVNPLDVVLNHLLKILTGECDEDEKGRLVSAVLSESKELLQKIVELSEKFPLSEGNIQPSNMELIKRYHVGMSSVIKGLEELLKWFESQKEDVDHLKNSVDNLFKGAQSFMNLINILEDNE